MKKYTSLLLGQKALEILFMLPRRCPAHWKGAQRLVKLGLAEWHTDPHRNPALEELTQIIKGEELWLTPEGREYREAIRKVQP